MPSLARTVTAPTDLEALVAFSDLTRFADFARQRSSRELFDVLAEYYTLVGDIVDAAGGTVVKFIGDAALLAWPAELADDGVHGLLRLQADGDAWWRLRDAACRHVIKAHVGPVTCGPVGTRHDRRFDLFGHTVNTAALLPSDGLALSPQVVRRLAPEMQRRFAEHPNETWVPVDPLPPG